MNQIVLVGRLTRDPELKTIPSGKNIARFSIAVDKRFKPTNGSEPSADFFNISCWEKTADYVSNYLGKGRLVSVVGRMESRKYTDKEGAKREVWEVTAEQVNGLDRAPEDSGSRPASGAQPKRPAPQDDSYDPFSDD